MPDGKRLKVRSYGRLYWVTESDDDAGKVRYVERWRVSKRLGDWVPVSGADRVPGVVRVVRNVDRECLAVWRDDLGTWVVPGKPHVLILVTHVRPIL